MRLIEQIDGYVETDVQSKDGRLKLSIDRSKNHTEGYVYVVNVDIVITTIDKPVNQILKDLYGKLPVEFLSATQTTMETPGLYINLKSPNTAVYDMPDTDDLMDLKGVLFTELSGVYDPQFFHEYEQDVDRLFGGDPINITTNVLQWYNNVKTAVKQIQPHIKRLNLNKYKTFFIIKPEVPLHKKPFTYVVVGSGYPFKDQNEKEKYQEFLSAIVSDYGSTVDLRIS